MAGTGVPPINIEGTADWSSLSRMMNSKGIQFSKARTAGTSVKVFTNTPADYRQLVALLESIKRPFFTYQLKEDRMDQRVIRGLPREMSVNDIKEDLESQGIADAVVQQLTSRTTKKPLPLFLVKTKMPEKLAEIQRLAMLTVSFERKKKSSEPSQCYRCQRYGHTQRNCRLAERNSQQNNKKLTNRLGYAVATLYFPRDDREHDVYIAPGSDRDRNAYSYRSVVTDTDTSKQRSGSLLHGE
ncbi:unnamed protein product [Acanthoscelides obtectus]|uniref:CCHC-type domain-containing protein n=1 Tax=Acanthoscelides obtectus TaxID=200917 RepID=A0A9P0MH32_ACAOB|nr:unnamed protein product [Acanthoscelides obtectus]CAK1686388.1 Nucleic-acid-binding protein from transposon X-element [Acanthoscelides obtectus]